MTREGLGKQEISGRGTLMDTTQGGASMGADVFFILMGAILVFAMHGGFAFLEAETARRNLCPSH